MSQFLNDSADADLEGLLSSLGPLRERRGGGSSVADSGLGKEVVETQGMFELSSDVVKHEGGVKKVEDGQGAEGKKYRLFQVPPADSDLFRETCGGLIGFGSTICIKSNCSTKHRGQEESSLRMRHLYVRKGAGEVFAELVVKTDVLSASVYADWMQDSYTLDDWRAKFLVCNLANSESASQSVTEDLLTSSQAFAIQAQTYRTPSKPPPGGLARPSISDDLFSEDFSPYKRQVEATTGVDHPLSLMGTEEIQKLVMGIDLGLSRVSAAVGTLKSVHQDHVTDVNKGLKSTESRVDSILSELGARPLELPPVYEAPTTWGTISSIAEDLSDVKANMVTLGGLAVNNSTLSTSLAITATKIVHEAGKTSNTRITTIKEGLVKGLQLLSHRVDDLTDEDGNLDLSSFNQATRSEEESFTLLKCRVENLESETAELGSVTRELTGDRDGVTIKFGDLGFSQQADANAYLEMHGDNSCGLLVDYHTLMQHVYNQIRGVDSINQMNFLKKVGMRTMAEGTAIGSFERLIPAVLSVATSHVVVRDTECVFDAIPSWAQWIKVHSGYRARFQKEINKFQVSHSKTIDHALPKESPFRSLAKLSLSLSVAFAKEIIAFFDESVEEFTMAKLSKEKAMHIGSSMKAALIEFVAEPRSGVVASLQTIGERAHINNSQLVFWATLGSLDKMAAVTELDFKNHPKVSSALVKFLAVNTGMEAITSLETRLDKIDVELKEAVKTAKTCASTAATAKLLVDELTKRVSRLEAKK